jgi:hypothetical protein
MKFKSIKSHNDDIADDDMLFIYLFVIVMIIALMVLIMTMINTFLVMCLISKIRTTADCAPDITSSLY